MKRIICLVLVLLTVVCTLCACGGGKTDPSGATEAPTDPSERFYFPANHQPEDYGGITLRLLVNMNQEGTSWPQWQFYYQEGLEGDIVNDAVVERDTVFQDKYNVKLEFLRKTRDEMNEYARNAIQAGSNDFDVIFPSLYTAASLTKNGLLLDLKQYGSHLNLDADYWDQDFVKQMTIGGRLYFANSSLNLVDKHGTWTCYFSKPLFNKYPELLEGYEDLYEMVNEGKWTIERMENMVKKVSADSDGDGQMTNEDTWGHVGEGFSVTSLMIGCGTTVTKKDENDYPVYCFGENLDETYTNYEHVFNTVRDYSVSRMSSQAGSYDALTDIFVDGRALFYLTGMGTCRAMRDSEFEFGIAPMPKANEKQERYLSVVSWSFADCICIPTTAENVETICDLLDAYVCLGKQTTYTAYIDRQVTYKLLRDDVKSKAMLELMFSGHIYDIADVFNIGQNSGNMWNGGFAPDKLASQLKTFEKQTVNRLKKFTEDMQENEKNLFGE